MQVTTRATIAGARHASGERRVREELAEAPEGVIRSWELSFVPAQRRPSFEAHDEQTVALIAEQKRIEALTHGAAIAKRPDEWNWIDTMHDAAQKQRHVEPLIYAVQRDPVTQQEMLLFLLIVREAARPRGRRIMLRSCGASRY